MGFLDFIFGKKEEEKKKKPLPIQPLKKLVDFLPRSAPAPIEPLAPPNYTVRPNDTLWDITKNVNGDPTLWPKLYQENREVIGDNPNLILPKQELRLSPIQPKISLGPRIDLLPKLKPQRQSEKTLSIPSPPPLLKMRSAHEQTIQPLKNEPDYKSAFIKGTLDSLVGKAVTPLVEKITGRDVDLSTLPEPTTFGEKALSFGSGMVTDLPLWLAGDAALAKPLTAIAKTKPISKAIGAIPKALTPALTTGVRAGSTYGGVIAPLETAVHGDGLQGLIEREKQVPLMALGGAALHGAFQGVGAGAKLGKDVIGEGGSLRQALALRKLGTPEMRTSLSSDVQNAFKSSSPKAEIKPVQSDLSNPQKLDYDQLNKIIIDKYGMNEYLNLVQEKPTLIPKSEVDKFNSLYDLLDKGLTPPSMELGIPLKARGLKSPQPMESLPTQRVLPEKPGPLTWTNRDGIQGDARPLPIRSITEENLGRLPKQKESNFDLSQFQRGAQAPIKTPTGQVPNLSLNPPLGSGQLTPPLRPPTRQISNLDPTSKIQIPIRNGRLDLDNVIEVPPIRSMSAAIERPTETLTIDPIRPMGNNQVNRLTQGTSNKVVGAEPDIPAGFKERGVSENIRTDANRPDTLRDSYSADPLVYKQLGNKETLAKAQSVFDKGLEPAITELDVLIKDLKPEAAPLVKMIADKLTLDGNVARARELMSSAANRATESGQFGQAFRILRDADPETFLMTFDKMLKKLNKEGFEQYGKKWKDFDLTPDELTLINGIERGNQSSYDSVLEQIQSRMANEMPASGWEKINAWRHMSMLLNAKTHIRNVGGNAIMMGMRKSAQRVSGVLQKVFLKESERTQSVFVDKEYKQMASEYFESNKKDLLGGANKYQENVSVHMPDKRVFRKSRIGEKLGLDIDVMEKARKFNYALLQKGDNPFFQNAYIDRLASYAQAKGVKNLSELSQEAFDIARMEAEQATYKDASIIADFINKAKKPPRDANIARKGGAILAEAALPFTKTPINIVKRGLQYSPVGVANGLAGLMSSREASLAIDELAKGLTGTGVLGLGYLLASKGILTGKVAKDADLKAYDSNTGNSPFSVLGKFDYSWAQPFSIPLSVGVEIYNAIKDNPEDVARMNSVVESNNIGKLQQMATGSANAIIEGMNASGDTVFNMSLMRGVKQLIGGQMGFMEGMAQLPQSYATQFIPTVSNQLAGTIDPIVRQTYVKGNYPETFKNTMLSRIPIASKTLEPKQTPFGEDVKRIENPIGRAASQFLSPGIISKNQGIDPKIDTELRRLNEFGFTKQFPTIVPNYIEKTQTHPRITLTPEETTQYQKRVGELTLDSFSKVMNKGSYANARDNKKKNKTAEEIRADLLAEAIADAKAQAKKEILKSKGLK